MADPKQPLVLPKSHKHAKPQQASVLTSDPATLLISMAVLNHVRSSVSEMRKWLVEQRPELEIVLDGVLARMKQAGWIDIVDDRIFVLPESILFNMRDPNVATAIHGVANQTMKRVHKNLMEDHIANSADNMAWAAVPDHAKVRSRLAEMARQYKASLNELMQECAKDPEIRGEQCRFVMIMNGPIRPEDF